jgi:hypothetical protein
LPATAIVAWVASLTWTLMQFGFRGLHACALAEVAVLATFQTAPDLPQSLYWQTGMLTYVLPLILATLLIGWIRRAQTSWRAVVLSSAVTFVAGGLSETYLIPQNVALTLALLVSLRLRWRGSSHLAGALVGGLLALAAIVVSPSIESRVGGSPADLWLALSAAIATAMYQVARMARDFPLTILLLLAVPGVLRTCQWRVTPRALMIVTALVLVTLPFCYFPSFYAQNGNPPARSLIVPGAVVVGYLVYLGVALQGLVARWSASPVRRGVALGLLALVPLGVALTTLPEQANAARYAALFDAEDQQIRASRDAGQTDLTVAPLPPNLGENFVTSDRSDWFNMCVARYYGVHSIATQAT